MRITYQHIIGAGAATGAGAAALHGLKSDDDSKIANAGLAAVAGGGTGVVAGRYAGPQAGWFLAERAMGKHNARNMQVLDDLKRNRFAGLSDEAIHAYDVVSAKLHKNAFDRGLAAAAPNRALIFGVALLSAGFVGWVAHNAINKVD
jgi:hypothetical protein